MKKLILTLILAFASSSLLAQMGINRKDVSSVSALIDFPEGTTNGIVLPAVTSAGSITSPVNGTIVFDRSDQRLKYYQNNAWVSLSEPGDLTKAPAVNPNPSDENLGAIISQGTRNNVKGVLELRSNTKAIVLPKVANPHTSIPSPVAGTMVYDTVSQSVALFDGLVWNYLVED